MSEHQQKQAQQEQLPTKTQGWRKLLARRWLIPAVYLVVAGFMLAMMWSYQTRPTADSVNEQVATVTATGAGESILQDNAKRPSATDKKQASKQPVEMMKWPTLPNEPVSTVLSFYDATAPAAAREQALVTFQRTFVPHTGIDFARKDGKSFAVVSALSGTVSRVETHPLLGQIVEITHENNLVTVYQSLAKTSVALNQAIRQGEPIGTAGRNEFEKHLGVHVHFEVRQNGVAVNPKQWVPHPPNM